MRNLIFAAALILFSGYSSTVLSQPLGLEIGNKSPEIKLPNLKGDTIALSSLKGKLVLIDFWGTWCAPCVEEQKDLAALYSKFKMSAFNKGKGFEIYGVSLDAKKSNWEAFIAKNHIGWIQVSDLKFWRSPVTKTYNIQALPYNVLIDGNGIILGSNLHGKDLELEITKWVRK